MTFLLSINFQLTGDIALLIYLNFINLLISTDRQYGETFFRFWKFLLVLVEITEKAYIFFLRKH